QDYVDPSRRGDPGPAHRELNGLVDRRMKAEPGMSYERAFTAEYLHPDNRSLKDRVDQESELHARALSPSKPFPNYGNPGDVAGGGRVGHTVGRSGKKPVDYAGG